MVCATKALAAGAVSLSALLGTAVIFDRVFDSVERSVVHSSTFRENPLAMTNGLAVLHVLREDAIVERSARMGAALVAGLRDLATTVPGIREVRGRGLMIGVELDPPALAIDMP
ncbi:MAG: aminotransferase class III-fold pyridoxal phosphate-dependent enzyme, partial [Phycisphaera sp.]|nr:aminotransferase class III-fold pyridoxal phosphate-dependent enzyme [Phycisphaera sp.]